MPKNKAGIRTLQRSSYVVSRMTPFESILKSLKRYYGKFTKQTSEE